jgi:hypothetical protein
MVTKKQVARTAVEATRHPDRRVDIPTEDLRDFVAEGRQPAVRAAEHGEGRGEGDQPRRR